MIKKSICKACGKEFEYKAIGGRLKRYCSDECKAKIANQRAVIKYRREHPKKPLRPRKFKPVKHTCLECGKEFEQIRPDVNGMFCSKTCHMRWEHKHHTPWSKYRYNAVSSIPLKWVYQCICPECGKHFETDIESKKYCSQDCASSARAKAVHQIKVSKFVPKKRKCKWCGKEFLTTFENQRQVFCTTECCKKYWVKQISKNREERLRGAALVDLDITLGKLSERDNGICYICGKPVNWDDHYDKDGHFIAGDTYPSIEHVIPISKGGEHSWSNVKLAHRRCNYLKSNKS